MYIYKQHVYISTNNSIALSLSLCIYIYIHMNTHIHIYIYTYTYIYIYIYISYTCIHIHVYIYIYIYTHIHTREAVLTHDIDNISWHALRLSRHPTKTVRTYVTQIRPTCAPLRTQFAAPGALCHNILLPPQIKTTYSTNVLFAKYSQSPY